MEVQRSFLIGTTFCACGDLPKGEREGEGEEVELYLL